MGICAFCYIWNVFSVVVFQRSMLNWRKVHLPLVYVHSSICETYLVWWFSRDLCSIEGGYICLWYMCILPYVKLIWCGGFPRDLCSNGRRYICLWYMCILLYVKLIWCGGFPEIYAWMKGDTSAFGICAFFHMWNLFGVVVLHRSMFN